MYSKQQELKMYWPMKTFVTKYPPITEETPNPVCVNSLRTAQLSGGWEEKEESARR
jgi:hypothetical protein